MAVAWWYEREASGQVSFVGVVGEIVEASVGRVGDGVQFRYDDTGRGLDGTTMKLHQITVNEANFASLPLRTAMLTRYVITA